MKTITKRVCPQTYRVLGIAVDGNFDQSVVTRVTPDRLAFTPKRPNGVKVTKPTKVYVGVQGGRRVYKVDRFEVERCETSGVMEQVFTLGAHIDD